MKTQIENLITNKLPKGFVYGVSQHKNVFSKSEYLQIWFACSDHLINNVRGQLPQVVSLALDIDSLELRTQIYGGMGGGCIYREPNMQDPKEKYLAMKSVKVPFRKPKANEESVLKAIDTFISNYINTLKENKEVLRYKNIVDYDTLLG